MTYNQHEGIRDRFKLILDSSPPYRGLSNNKIGKLFGVSGQHLGQILKSHEPLSAKIGFTACLTTGYSIDWLFTGEGPKRTTVWRSEGNLRLIQVDMTDVPEECDDIIYHTAQTLQLIFRKLTTE